MAFGKYTNDYNVRSRASSLSAVDEGLRKFMLRVYGYMSAGLAITGVISYPTYLLTLLYQVTL